jgi:hypothetical protein
MNSTSGTKYAIAVRDEDNLFVFIWVKRSMIGEVFAFMPRPQDPSINAHASYHADGRYHVKSHNMDDRNKIMYQKKQKPDQNFIGAEHVLEQTITLSNVRSIGMKYNPSEFSDVFEISANELETKMYVRVTSDLVSPGHGPNLVPGARVIQQKECRSYSPYIVFTLYEMPEC